MRKRLFRAAMFASACLAFAASAPGSDAELAEKLKASIPAGETVFFYEFNADEELADSAKNLPELALKAPATVDPQAGRQGGGLVVQSPVSIGERGNCAELKGRQAGLFPPGSLSFDFFYKPDDAVFHADDIRNIYLIDQMYTEQSGFQITYNLKTKRVTVRIGNGSKVLSATTHGLTLAPSQWVHLAFTYDSKDGRLAIYENGAEAGSAAEADFGPVDYGSKPLRVGNRIGSHYGNASGVFDEIRMTRRPALF